MQEDHQHIAEILAGNKKAFSHLVVKYQDLVFTICMRVLKRREEAEEAAQDSFVKAFKRLRSYRKEAKFSTWLYRIAYNTAIDYSRKVQHHTISIDEKPSITDGFDFRLPTQWEQLKKNEQQKYLQEAIQLLPAEEGSIITLYYLHERSVEETSKIVNLSVSNVKVKLFRSRQKLRRILERLLQREAEELL
ncbi:MAG: sigma-70 family RNA polymerase sigma factor [Bacteroidota bacterium]